MKVDLHVHSNYSPDSRLPVEEILDLAHAHNLPLIALTDHENVEGCLKLKSLRPGFPLLPGIEVTAREGDFLVYCLEPERLLPLQVRGLRSIRDLQRGDDLAVVWAHPLTRRFGEENGYYACGPGLEEVMACIDGVEILNGKVMTFRALKAESEDYPERMATLARSFGKSPVGGSDSHHAASFMNCWTNLPRDLATPRGVIRAIKQGLTTAGQAPAYFRRISRAVFSGEKV